MDADETRMAGMLLEQLAEWRKKVNLEIEKFWHRLQDEPDDEGNEIQYEYFLELRKKISETIAEKLRRK